MILGDDKGGPAFAQFSRQVENANKAVDRNNAALKRQSAASKEADKGVSGLIGSVTGFGDAAAAASGKGSTFGRVLAGVNVATGVAEPLMAGLVVAAGGIAAAYGSAALGLGVFGAVASSVLSQASDAAKKYTQAQLKAAQATNAKQRTAALAQEKAALYGLDAAQKSVVFSIIGAQDAWKGFTRAATPGVAKVLAQAIKLLPDAFALLKPFLAPVESALSGIIGSMKAGIGPGSAFSRIMHDFAASSGTTLSLALRTAGNVFMGLLGVVHSFLPEGVKLITWVEKASEKFRQWGTTLSGHSGFQSLMSTFRTETPLAVQVLKNLGTVILNVGKAMTGLAGVGNSRSLLQLLIPLSGVLAQLSKNTALDRIVLYLLAATSAANKLGPAFLGVKSAAVFFPNLWKDIVKFAAVTEGATAAEVIAAAATRAWGIAMAALPWVALAAAVVAVAVLIIKYHTQIWAFMRRVWNDILGFIMRVWHWIQGNWPLLLAILTGPVGLAIRWIVQNFGGITTAVKTVLSAISVAWNATWNTLKGAFRTLVVDWILTPLGWIVHAAATAFGWVPGLGGKLKTAARAFDQFKADVNRALGGINNKTVAVSVAMTSATNPYGGINPKKATGGLIMAGTGPTADDVPILVSRGELIVPAHLVRAGAVDHLRGRLPGFAAGGGVGIKATAPSYKTVEASLMASVMKLAVVFAKAAQAAKAASAGGGPGVSGAGPVGGDAAANKKLARQMFPWPASQWAAFDTLEMHEAGYNRFARNASSGAYGIPQALPPTKMPFAAQAAGGSHAGPQLSWMFAYIRGRYGTPANAWAKYYQHPGGVGWYGGGLDAMFSRPTLIGVGERGPERVTVTPAGGSDAMLDELRALRAEVRQLTGVAAAIPASTGRHVAGAVGGAGADAAFRRRYPGR